MMKGTIDRQTFNDFNRNDCMHVQSTMMFLLQVKVGFLIVGHTHEDIDQVFRKAATWIKRKDMATLPDLVDKGGTATSTSCRQLVMLRFQTWA